MAFACDGNSIVMSWQWRQQTVQQPSDLKILFSKSSNQSAVMVMASQWRDNFTASSYSKRSNNQPAATTTVETALALATAIARCKSP